MSKRSPSLGAHNSLPVTAVFWAEDLTNRAGQREVWAHAGAPAGDGAPRASLMGYWFHSADATQPVPPNVSVVRLYADSRSDRAEDLCLGSTPSTRRIRCVSLDPRPNENAAIRLAVDEEEARVWASGTAWEAMSQGILLAIAQYWRFAQVERAFERLGALGREARRYAVMPTLATWRHRKWLVASDRYARDLVDDWVHFEGLLADPAHYCSSETAIHAYRDLATKLELHGWAERLDDGIEVVAGGWEMITERLLHYKLFAWGVILELIIIALIGGLYYR